MEAKVIELRSAGYYPASNPAVTSPTRPLSPDDRPESPDPFEQQIVNASSEQRNENTEDFEPNSAAMSSPKVLP